MHRWRGWRVVLKWAEVDGRLEPVAAYIGTRFDDPNEPEPRPLTASIFRAAPFGKIMGRGRRQLVGHLRFLSETTEWLDGLPIPPAYKREARRLLPRAEVIQRGPGGRPRYSPDHLARVAQVYTDAHRRADHPTQAVARWAGVSQSAAAKQVARARADGFLPKTTKGKAAGIRTTPERRKR